MFSWKYRIHAICVLSVLAIIVIPWVMNKPDQNTAAAADSAARELLQMVDAGNYADSWQIAAPYLKEKVTAKDWEAQLAKDRKILGPLVERTLDEANFTAAVKELPDSNFILLEYLSKFERKEVKEVVTVVQGSDNRWRVIGYFIQ